MTCELRSGGAENTSEEADERRWAHGAPHLWHAPKKHLLARVRVQPRALLRPMATQPQCAAAAAATTAAAAPAATAATITIAAITVSAATTAATAASVPVARAA